jgi:hypothetical protein
MKGFKGNAAAAAFPLKPQFDILLLATEVAHPFFSYRRSTLRLK